MIDLLFAAAKASLEGSAVLSDIVIEAAELTVVLRTKSLAKGSAEAGHLFKVVC